MKHITKRAEPAFFAQWRKGNRGVNWQDFSTNNQELKEELKQQLCEEQEGLCCYCEVKIESDYTSHIEHFKPRSQFQRDIFKYGNLLASCVLNDSCGHKKQGEYFSRMVSPLDSGCQGKFTYTANGRIIPKDEKDSFAQRTIDLLGLDCKDLRHRRRAILRTLDSPGMDNDYILESIDNCRDWYDGFYTLIEYVACKRGVRN
jgi:uncharacterized protein (TIGR02646 family)